MSKSIEVRPLTKGELASNTSTTHPNDVKFGVTTPFRESDKGGELVLLPHDKPLAYAVETVAKTWKLEVPSDYALKFSEPPCHYVTEGTRKELSGKLVSLQYSPHKVSEDVVAKIKSGSDKDIVEGITKLASNAADPTVADVFVGIDGLTALLELMEKEKPNEWQKEAFVHALQSFLDIMLLSNEATWDKVQPAVISKVASYVNNSPKSSLQKALGPALQVLENAVTVGVAYTQVDKEVTLPIIIMHVQNADAKVQQNALALMNALLLKGDPNKRKALAATLASRKYRDIILQHVINKKDRLSETNHELYVMQTVFLNLLDEKRKTPVDPQDQDALNKIRELYRIAFESDTSNYSTLNFDPTNAVKREKSNAKKNYRRLGFSNDTNPEVDFALVPPGTLALDCMYHLATTHQESYNKIVLEGICRTTGDECPFARSSITLVNLICDILKIGEPPGDQQWMFYPFVFQHEKPLEELFCICSQLVTKTWKEMKAAVEDFDKVFDVVRDQIKRALDKIPDNFEQLRSILHTLTYAEITKIRERERISREEWELQAKPIQDLKKKLEPEMMDLIKQNRINYLIAGTRFNRFQPRSLMRVKEKFWFCRLSPNAKVFHYGDCEEKATPLPEELTSKINVIDIKDLLIGKDCPHMKDSKVKKSNCTLAFSLVQEKESLQTLDFIAPDEKTFNLWTDGISALLGKPMTSKTAKDDLDTLLHMEIKLRLLEIEGIPEIPQEAPPIPELPSNFDFSSLQINVK